MENLRLKRLFIHDPTRRKTRLFRVMWEANGGPVAGGHSAKLSVAFVPKLFDVKRETFGTRVTLLGIEMHAERSYGGIYA